MAVWAVSTWSSWTGTSYKKFKNIEIQYTKNMKRRNKIIGIKQKSQKVKIGTVGSVGAFQLLFMDRN